MAGVEPMTLARPTWATGLMASVPIVLGYLPIAFSFGVAATRAGFSMAEATALSVLIYAGASQFLALALVTSGAPVLLKTEMVAGHGGVSGRYEKWREVAFEYAWVLDVLGVADAPVG